MSTIRITCPDCSLSRELPAEKIPDRPVQVTCPRCKGSFSFSKSPGEETVPEPPGKAPAAVMAAQAAAATAAAVPPHQTAAAPPEAPRPAQHPPARESLRPATRPGGQEPAAARPDGTDTKSPLWQRLRLALLLLLLVTVIYQLREQIPFLKKVRVPVKVRQVITIPPPSGPLPAGSITLQSAPAAPQTESVAPPSAIMTPSTGKRLTPFDISVFIYAVNAPGKVRVNGQDYKEIKGEPDMQYNINAFGDPFRFGSNTIDFELSPQKGGNRSFPPEVRMTVSRTIGSERKSIGEWRLSDKEGWKRSVTLDVPEVTSP